MKNFVFIVMAILSIGSVVYSSERVEAVRVPEEGSMMDQRCTDCETFMAAIQKDHLDCVTRMINDGQDPNETRAQNKVRLLHLAAYFDKSEVIRALVHGGAVVNIIDRDGRTPLDLANIEPKRTEAGQVLREAGGLTGVEVKALAKKSRLLPSS